MFPTQLASQVVCQSSGQQKQGLVRSWACLSAHSKPSVLGSRATRAPSSPGPPSQGGTSHPAAGCTGPAALAASVPAGRCAGLSQHPPELRKPPRGRQEERGDVQQVTRSPSRQPPPSRGQSEQHSRHRQSLCRIPLIAVSRTAVKGLEKVIVTKLPAVRIAPGPQPS